MKLSRIESDWSQLIDTWSLKSFKENWQTGEGVVDFYSDKRDELLNHFVNNYPKEFTFLLKRLKTSCEPESLCAFEALETMMWQNFYPNIPSSLFLSTIELPEVMVQELREDENFKILYATNGYITVGDWFAVIFRDSITDENISQEPSLDNRKINTLELKYSDNVKSVREPSKRNR